AWQPKNIIEEAVLLIPHPLFPTHAGHSRCDPQKMLKKLDRHILVGRVDQRQFRSDLKHVLREESHPFGAVRLVKIPASRQRRTTIEDADVVQTQKAAFERVSASAILAVDPPGKIQQQLLKRALEPFDVSLPFLRLFQSISEYCRPGVNRRIDIAEVPF